MYRISFCHRMPERTFKIKGHYFPVCSRCTGIYLGALCYSIYTYFFYVKYTWILILLAILMIIPTFIDGFTQLLEMRESNNTLRFTTGLISGLGLMIIAKFIKYIVFISIIK
jgi:uncharacterized membrane protein